MRKVIGCGTRREKGIALTPGVIRKERREQSEDGTSLDACIAGHELTSAEQGQLDEDAGEDTNQSNV